LSIERLITHLEHLYAGEEDARDDKNIHTLSTEKSSVKILTMHAAKGLEFPVVFLINRDSPKIIHGPDTLLWTDADKNRHITPCISVNDLRDGKGKDLEPLERYNKSQEREHRRLLYVAMTRPQAMLFVPMRIRSEEKKVKIDNDITPRLNELLTPDNPNIEIFNDAASDKTANQTSGININEATPIPLDDIPALSRQKLINVETSYSQISRELKAASHDDDLPALIPDDDGDDVLRNDEQHAENISQPLPGGRTTGDALHRAIDELMRSDDVNAIINDSDTLDKLVERHLKRGGILDLPSTTDPPAAIKQASSYIKTALTTPYPSPNGGDITISALPKSDRISEMEFLLSCAPNTSGPPWDQIIKTNNLQRAATPYRIRGFIDLVFRLKNEACPAHPYRYYIIDWKSDTLDNYAPESLRRYCADQNYLLQSQIYTIALDKYLNGILGERYDKGQNLGGSLYVFLRGEAGVFL